MLPPGLAVPYLPTLSDLSPSGSTSRLQHTDTAQAMAHPPHEGVELAMDESNASQPIRLGSRSLCGNALPFSLGMQLSGAELS